MQNDGVITTAELPNLLTRLVAEHETGELRCEWSGIRSNLYFMFGRFYHAESGEARGSEVLYALLRFPAQLQYHFTTGFIPADASVEESLEEILANVATTPPVNNAARPSSTGPSGISPVQPQLPVDPVPASANTPSGSPAKPLRPITGSMLIKSALPNPNDKPFVLPPVAHLYRSLAVVFPLGIPQPVLAGPFNTLVGALHMEGFSGYAMSSEDGGETGLAFYNGQIWHAYRKADLGEYMEGERVLTHLRRTMSDISFTPYRLDHQVVSALNAQLQPAGAYSGLSVRIVRVRYLMESLAEGRHTGTVTFTNTEGARADVIFSNGRFIGSFGQNQETLRNEADWIRDWLEHPDTLIDVRSARARPLPIDGSIRAATEQGESDNFSQLTATGANEQLYATLGAADHEASRQHRPAAPSLRDADLESQLTATVSRLNKHWHDLVVDKRKKQDLKSIILTLTNLVNDTLDLYETVNTIHDAEERLFKVLEQRPAIDEPYFSIFELVKGHLNVVRVMKAHNQAVAKGKEYEALFFNETVQILIELLRSFLEYYTQQIKNGGLQKRSRDIAMTFVNEISYFLLHS